ncbi:hypothetical protein fh0823_17150 [Francisella halioticida]|uniref:hypothetical protein n=1 Tax=Francisella halioticida TaxID=549298 RepID=UPI001AFB0DCB|nr:hypothetical protein [Francisella halioticida]BCD91576.1 hypothetical protein fh0823_17150 [Francisella halioticida]
MVLIKAFIDSDNGSNATLIVISQLSYILAILFGSWFVFPKAISSVKRFDADMNLLMVIAIVCAAAIGQFF